MSREIITYILFGIMKWNLNTERFFKNTNSVIAMILIGFLAVVMIGYFFLGSRRYRDWETL